MFLQTSAIKHYHLNFLNKLVLCQLWIEIVLCRIGMNIFPGTCTIGYANSNNSHGRTLKHCNNYWPQEAENSTLSFKKHATSNFCLKLVSHYIYPPLHSVDKN